MRAATAAGSPSTPEDGDRTSVVAREPRAGRGRCVGAAIVVGRYLDVLLAGSPVLVLPLDPNVGKVYLLVEVRKMVRERPVLDLVRIPVRSSVTIRALAVSVLQEVLVVALQLEVQDDPAETSPAPRDAFRGPNVRPVHLDVVFELAELPHARVERLASLLAARPAVGIQKVAAFLREGDDMVPTTLETHGLDQPSFAQMSQVSTARIDRSAVMVAEVARGDDSEGSNGGRRAALRAAEFVRPVAQGDGDALAVAGQVKVAREQLTRIVGWSPASVRSSP